MILKLVIFNLVLIAACATVEETGRVQLNAIPDGQMNSLGDEAFEDIKKKEKQSTNKAQVEQITRIAQRIATASGADFKWEFIVLDEPKTVNAFCLPGGKIAVYTGILPVAKNEAALAAVLGHEVAHATARHGNERMSQGLIAQIGMVSADVLLKDNKYRGGIMAALGLGAQVGVLLPYSRSHEAEADKIGLKYSAKAGYDPSEASELWLRMAKLGGGKMPEFLSTHPDSEKRAKNLQNQVPDVASMYEQSEKQPKKDLIL